MSLLQRPWFQCLLLALALLMYLYMPVYTIGQQRSDNDFKHIYLGMKALLDGNTPYPIQSLQHQASLQGYRQLPLNPYVYLPFTGYSMAFLAPFTLCQASWVWFALNHCFALASLIILSRLFPRWQIGSLAIMIGTLAWNVPFYRTLSAGQLNMALLFLLTLAHHYLQSHRQGTAAPILAFAALFKLQPAIYAPFLLLRRQHRPLIIMLTTGAALLILSSIAAGTSITKEFLTILHQMSYGKSTWPWANSFWDDPPNQSLNSFFSHIFTISTHTVPWISRGQATANAFTLGVTLILIAAWAVAIYRPQKSPRFDHQDSTAFASTLILSLLVPSLLWDHYLVMLYLPLAIIVSHLLHQKSYNQLILIAICYGITAIPWNFESPSWQHGPGILLMSIKLWPTLVLFGLSLCLVKSHPGNLSETFKSENPQ